MLQAAVIGDHGSGKTTFLGLLYAALVRSGSDREDDLRFHANFESLEEITGLFQRLMSGAFPDAATKEGLHGLSFTLGLRGTRRGRLGRIGSRTWSAPATGVHFTLPGSLGGERPAFLGGGTIGTGPWRDVLDAHALVLLVDSTKLAPKAETSDRGPLAAFDGQVDALFSAIQRWRSRSGPPLLHPLFLLSKFDAVNPEVLEAANLEREPPASEQTASRAAYANALLGPLLPQTLETVRGKPRGRLRFGKPAYFFSWVRPEAGGPNRPAKIRLRRTEVGGWEPDYSRDEYLALVTRLTAIAADARD